MAVSEVWNAWRMGGIDESGYKPTSRWALKHLREYLKKNGIEEFEVVFQRKLGGYDEDLNEVGFVFLVKTDKEFILAKIASYYYVETDAMSVVIDLWAMETSLAKQIAKSILGLDKPIHLDKWINNNPSYNYKESDGNGG